MNKFYVLISLVFILSFNKVKACSNVTPTFTYSNSHTCGVPAVLNFTNTSSGSASNSSTTKYVWKVNGKVVDTTYGLTAPNVILLKSVTLHKIEMVAIEAGGCRDSFNTNVNVTTRAPQLLDQFGGSSYTPSWLNCIQYRTDPDSFLVNLKSADTLYNINIFWGDGVSNTGISVLKAGDSISHWYTSTGIFTYKVTLYNSSFSCTDTLYGKVINQRQPTAGILGPTSGSNRGCTPHTIQFKNNSYNVTSETSITWLFGDGETLETSATGVPDSVQHTYMGALCGGVVTLMAANDCGSSQTTWNPIDISEKDKANIGVDTNNCNPKVPFRFYNQTADLYCISPDPKEYYWDFGDGYSTGWIKSKAAQDHYYATDGVYTVMLIAKNNCGLDTTYFKFTVVYTPRPNFSISDSIGCQPVNVTAIDLSKGWQTTRLWNFGDGTTSSDSIKTHAYTSGGVFTLKLTVTNSCGSADTTKVINVFDKPNAKFGIRGEGCTPYKQSFFNNSTVYSDSTTYTWNFGDGTTSNVKNPSQKEYTIANNYTVSLIVNNTCGADTFLENFNIHAFPVNTINADSTTCTFDSFSVSLNANISSTYKINWGDGSNNNYSNSGVKKHVYTTAGIKMIEVSAQSTLGSCEKLDTIYVNVKPGALAAFNVDKSYACAPATFNINNNSINASNYWWYKNDSLISTNSALSAQSIAQDSSIVRIKLLAENAGFCGVDSIEKVFFTPKKVTADFTLSDSIGCGPLSVNFSQNTTTGVSFNWNFGNGNISSNQMSTQIFESSASQDSIYSVVLYASNWAQCTDSISKNILVYPKPSINFSNPTLSGCGPLNINFTNTSSPNDTGSIAIMNFVWDLGNGTSSSNTNENSTYLASNSKDSFYTVKLVGFSEHGCKDSLSKQIQVYPNPSAKFSIDKTEGCGPLSVNFNNLSTPNDTGSIAIMSFTWNINNTNNSNVNPSAAFIASNTMDSLHNIKLIAYSEHGCVDSTSKSVKVFPKPTVDFSSNVSQGCSPLSVNFTNNSSPKDTGSIAIMNFKWELGNNVTNTATNTSTIYASNGNFDSTYSIKLIGYSEHGCVDSLSKNIVSHPKSIAKLALDKNTGCGPLTVNFQEKSINGNQYFWDFGNGFNLGSANISHKFDPILLFDTFYNVSFTTTTQFGCTGDTAKDVVRVQGIPKASFLLSKDTTCGEEISLIYNTSLAAIQYQWNLGDGTTSSAINPSKIFKVDAITGGPKTYQIALIAKSIFGCTDTAKQTLTVMPFPKAKIGFDKIAGCGDLNIGFKNNSQFGANQNWNFGDGTTSNLANPIHTYTNATPVNKQFVVTMESVSSAGCINKDTTTVTVYPKPFLSISSSRVDVCDNGEIEFVSSSSNLKTSVWSFNDGSQKVTSTANSIKHTFPLSTYADSNFTVKLIGTSQFACVDSMETVVTLGPKLFVDFDQTPNSACVPAIADFTNLSRNATNYIWDFGDNAGSGDENPTHTYLQSGQYSVKLTAFDKNGCKVIKLGSNNFLAKETPVAEFVMSPGSLKLPNAKAIFSNLSIYKLPTTFSWDFGDGTTSIDENPIHTYADTGSYKVALKANNNSCSDVIIKQIIVDPSLPIVDFEPEGASGCAPLRVDFKEKTQFANKFTWIFGDGHSSTEPNPIHLYENEGFYTVTLMAEGPGGVSKIVKTNIIEVKSTPKCFFYATPDSAHLPNARFDMKNNTVNASQYTWQVNNSETGQLMTTSRLKEPSFIINEVGNFDVTLMAENLNQCHDTLVKPMVLIVLEEGKIYIPTAFTPNHDNKNDDFKPVTLGVSEKDYTFSIYNRWGEKIFQTNDLNGSWDGTVRDQPVAEAVFVWTISGKFASGEYFERKGTVTLLK